MRSRVMPAHFALALVVALLVQPGLASAAAREAPPPVTGAAGVVWAWGTNPTGELTNATTADSSVPVQVSRLTGVTAIAGDGHHTLAVTRDGTVWAWGANASGQLGSGVVRPTPGPTPTPVQDLETVVDVAAGVAHSLALKQDGSVWAWGDNSAGQLGTDPVTRVSAVPLQVAGLDGVVAISGGDHHSLALKGDGTVWAWGDNNYGQLGDGTVRDSSAPVQVSGLQDVTAVASGIFHNMALKRDGTVWTWGAGYYGQLGAGSLDSSTVPIQVPGLGDTVAIAAGVAHSLALSRDGTVWGWGWNDAGQLAQARTLRVQSTPLRVDGLDGVVGIAGGLAHSVAVRGDGTVWTWGDNSAGQLGDGTNDASLVPVQVATLSGIVTVDAGDGHSLALQSVASESTAPMAQSARGEHGAIVLGWTAPIGGGGPLHLYRDGELLTTLESDATSYTDSDATCGAPHWFKIAAFDGSVESAHSAFPVVTAACGSDAESSTGVPWAWGSNAFGQLGGETPEWSAAATCLQVQPLAGAASLAAGSYHSLALLQDGSVLAWGRNEHGQLGDGSVEDRVRPVQVSGLDDAVGLAGGSLHSLALTSSGTVWAWGDNSSGQLGSGIVGDSAVPLQVTGLGTIGALAAGSAHSLGLAADGTVWAWGRNNAGQLGNGTTWDGITPTQVIGLENVIAIGAGAAHSLAVTRDGTAWAWGDNSSGQLGARAGQAYTSFSSTPIQVEGLSNVTSVAAGVGYSLALMADGTVWTWGRYRYADRELQLAGPLGSETPPHRVGNLEGVTAIAAGGAHGLALRADGSVWSWGWNNSGQLGDGTRWDSGEPIRASALHGVRTIAAGLFHSLALESAEPAPTLDG